MSYRIDFTAEADIGFARLPPLVASSLLDGLDALAATDDPYDHIEPGHFPFRASWLFKHRCEVDAQRWICCLSVAIDVPSRSISVLWVVGQPIPGYGSGKP